MQGQLFRKNKTYPPHGVLSVGCISYLYFSEASGSNIDNDNNDDDDDDDDDKLDFSVV